MKDHIIGWIAGGAAAVALPFALNWLTGRGVSMFISWQLGGINQLLNSNTGDKDLDTFERDIVLAVVKLAQSKFPVAGFGPERKEFVVSFLTKKIPLLRGQEQKLDAIIDQICVQEKAMLDSIKP